eukprot:768438-Ditylum_brightwellii.AAC.1
MMVKLAWKSWHKLHILGENDDTDNDGAARSPVDVSALQLPLVQGIIVQPGEPVVAATATSPEPLVQTVPVQPNFVANTKKQNKKNKKNLKQEIYQINSTMKQPMLNIKFRNIY